VLSLCGRGWMELCCRCDLERTRRDGVCVGSETILGSNVVTLWSPFLCSECVWVGALGHWVMDQEGGGCGVWPCGLAEWLSLLA